MAQYWYVVTLAGEVRASLLELIYQIERGIGDVMLVVLVK